jgi:hypothetical protein
MPFDSSIQEDASLNYAKLSYEMGIRTKAYLRFCWALSKISNNASRSVVEKLLIDSLQKTIRKH